MSFEVQNQFCGIMKLHGMYSCLSCASHIIRIVINKKRFTGNDLIS